MQAQTNTTTFRGFITHPLTQQPVINAGIYWKKHGWGLVTDSLGYFEIKKSTYPNDTLVVSYVGCSLNYIPASQLSTTSILRLTTGIVIANDEVQVKSKFNKGLRWWSKVVAAKPVNNPYQYSNYAYELYNKLEVDINNVKKEKLSSNKIFKPFNFLLNNIDSTENNKKFLPVFLTETLSDYYYSQSPYKVREEVKATVTNGIKNETILQFLGGINQKLNVYDNYVNLFGKVFISPLSSLGNKFYKYKGADTVLASNGDKLFRLLFTPLHDGENTFSGECLIHQKTWAIQKISLSISPTANINFVNELHLAQEFAQTATKQWMVTKENFVADMSPLGKSKLSFIARKTASYKNITINQLATTQKLATNKSKEEFVLLDEAIDKGKTVLQSSRHQQLSANEQKVYSMVDTLKSLPAFKKLSNTITFLVDGHKQFNKIEIGPWYKWVSGNQLEKTRLRFDLGTTAKFSEQLRLYGYLAYGFADAKYKGKFGVNYRLPNVKGVSINASYLNDLDNGKTRNNDEDATVDNMFSQLIRRDGIKQKFMNIDERKLTISKEWSNHFSAQFSIIRTDFDTYQPLPSKKIYSYRDDDIVNTELGIKLRYAPGEKTITTHRRQRKLKTNSVLPTIEARLAVAQPHIMGSEYQYTKGQLSASQKIKTNRWGQIEYTVYGGKIWGNNVPFMMLELHPGNEIYYYNKQAFNLMNRFEYASDQYAGFTVEHNFDKKLINLLPFMRKSKIRQFWNVKTVYGDMSIANRKFNRIELGGYHVRSLKGNAYTEVGTGFDNIFRFFRIDAVWRFAPNITAANGAVINTTKQHFGIFGSFRLQL
jgi:Family of unknown function (DUF5686)/CarboxypepD_reg-like domain